MLLKRPQFVEILTFLIGKKKRGGRVFEAFDADGVRHARPSMAAPISIAARLTAHVRPQAGLVTFVEFASKLADYREAMTLAA